MLEVIDSFSRSKAESAELIHSAAVAAYKTRDASSRISAWCDRDLIRQNEQEYDSREYLSESIRYVMHLGHEAQARRERFTQLAIAIQAKRDQLVKDAQEIREFGMLDASDCQSIRDLDMQMMQVRQWAQDDEFIYEQAVDSLEGLYTRFVVIYPNRTGALQDTAMRLS